MSYLEHSNFVLVAHMVVISSFIESQGRELFKEMHTFTGYLVSKQCLTSRGSGKICMNFLGFFPKFLFSMSCQVF